MGELFRLNWRAVSLSATVKVSVGLLVMMALSALTGETWLATALAAMFAWLANTPGPIKSRLAGILVFAAAAIAFTWLSGWIELELWPNIIAISVISFLGTMGLALGVRGFMVGFSVICWAIYGPFMVSMTSVENCVYAILLGTGVVIALNLLGEVFGAKNVNVVSAEADAPAQTDAEPGLEPAVYNLTLLERFYGEMAGIVAAMLGMALLLWLQSRSRRNAAPPETGETHSNA